MEFTVPTAGPMAPPETDAQLLEPSSSAAKSRGRARKNAKQALPTLSTCTFSHMPGASRHGLCNTSFTAFSPLQCSGLSMFDVLHLLCMFVLTASC